MLNCLTEPSRQADFDANRKTSEDLIWESVLSRLADKVVEEESQPRIPAGGNDALDKSDPELNACRWGCWHVVNGHLSVLKKIETWSGAT